MSRPTKDPVKKKKQKKKRKKQQKKTKRKKKREEGAIFANPPSEDPLVDEPSKEKARKEWLTVTKHTGRFKFSEN